MMESNPIERLLDALPAAIAKQKRETIQAELRAVGLWEHWRQTIRKPGCNLDRMHFRAASIFKQHLGLSDLFFTSSPGVQQKEIRRIVTHYFKQSLSAY